MVKKIFAKSYIGLILIFMYLPILVLMIYSFTDTDNIGIWNTFTFKLYGDLFRSNEIMKALFNTILVAVSAAIVSTVLGTLGAIGIFYSRKKTKTALDVASKITISNDEIVTAISLTLLFVSLGITFNFVTLLIGHVVLTIPFVVLSVTPKLKQMDPNIYEAALDLGATPSRALRKVILPEIMPGIFSGFVLSITLSLDDFIITTFTRNNSFHTLSTYIYSIRTKGKLPPALRALTTLIFIIVLIGLFIYNNRINSSTKEKKERR